MADFTKKALADAPTLKARLKLKGGATATLTGATVTFSAWDRFSKTMVITDQPATILSATPPSDASDPNVEYDWANGNITTPGIYQAHWKVVYSGGAIEYFPDSGYTVIAVDADIA